MTADLFSVEIFFLRMWWRFGYGVPSRRLLTGAGWRLIFWRFWWLDVGAERDWLEGVARSWNVTPLSSDTNERLRRRIQCAMSVPGIKLREHVSAGYEVRR